MPSFRLPLQRDPTTGLLLTSLRISDGTSVPVEIGPVLVDTGANITCIPAKALTNVPDLALEEKDETEVQGVGGLRGARVAIVPEISVGLTVVLYNVQVALIDLDAGLKVAGVLGLRELARFGQVSLALDLDPVILEGELYPERGVAAAGGSA